MTPFKPDANGKIINPRDSLEASLQFTPLADKFIQGVKLALENLERKQKEKRIQQLADQFNLLDTAIEVYHLSPLGLKVKDKLIEQPYLTQKEIAVAIQSHQSPVSKILRTNPLIFIQHRFKGELSYRYSVRVKNNIRNEQQDCKSQ